MSLGRNSSCDIQMASLTVRLLTNQCV